MDSSFHQNFDEWSLDGEVEALKLDDAVPSFSGGTSRHHDDEDFSNLIGELDSANDCDEENLDDLLDDVLNDDELSAAESIEVNPFDGLPYSSQYFDLLEKRRQLPVWKAKDDFVMAVEESSIVLVAGRPGSGKSTQIPQWCVQFAKESEFRSGTVVCSQPSPLSAMSLAIQVAQEMDFTDVGNEIGYEVPYIKCCGESTVLKFTTDELLLREMAEDPLLKHYNFVIIDEAQERSLSTDVLLALFRSMPIIRENLKVIIVSLSHEMEKLEEFFEEVPVVDLYFLEGHRGGQDACAPEDEGSEEVEKKRRKAFEDQKMFELKITYAPTEQSDLIDDVVNLVIKLHCDQTIAGDVMVFLPSSKEIEETCEKIIHDIAMKALRGIAGEIKVLPLYNDLEPGKQQALYESKFTNSEEECALKKRLVIVADELAESSFLFDEVSVVIDSGIKVEKVFNGRTRTAFSLRKRISHNSAILRSSRCRPGGRVYRLYSESEYKEMDEISVPSINRAELTSLVLVLKRLLQRLNMNFTECQFIDPPDPEAYMLALEELDYHGALDDNGNLTDLGAVMSEFPLSVSQTKCVISACGEDCVQEILSIISMVTAPPIWKIPRGSEEKGAEIKRKLGHDGGDHFTLLNIYQLFITYKRSEAWCLKNFINYNSLKMADRIREDILGIMEKLELPISCPISDPRVVEISVKRALLAGYFMQVARDTDGCGNYLIIRDRHVARIHPNSIVKRSSEWIVYEKFLLTENGYVTIVSNVTPSWIAEVTPHSYLINLPDHETKTFLLKVSAKWRKKLAQENLSQEKPESSSDGGRTRLDSNSRSSEEASSNDIDDVDVLTQAARGMAYAYNQATDYLGKTEMEDSNCVIQ